MTFLRSALGYPPSECSGSRADDLKHRSVWRVEMPPAKAVGALDLSDESDPGIQHRFMCLIEIVHPKRDDGAGGEERMEFVGRSVDLKDRIVRQP